MVCFKCFLPVDAGSAASAWRVPAAVAAPCQLIRHMEPQSGFYDACLAALDKRGFLVYLFSAAFEYGTVHVFEKIHAAVRVGTSGGIILMIAVINTAAFIRKRHAGGTG